MISKKILNYLNILVLFTAVLFCGCSTSGKAACSKQVSPSPLANSNAADKNKVSPSPSPISKAVDNPKVAPLPSPGKVTDNKQASPLPSSIRKVVGKKIQASASSFSSPIQITIGDEISGSITENCKDNCYSFTTTSKTQFNLFARKPSSITVNFYLVKTSDLTSIAKYGTMSSEFSQYIIPQSRSQSRFMTGTNTYEYAQIYTLLPGSYSLCVGEHASFNYPLAYTFVTFLGDLSENPWTGEYTLKSDSATGLGYGKSSSSGSSQAPNIGKQWEKEREDAEERERRIDYERHMHPNLTHP